MPEDSVDAIITDPSHGITGEACTWQNCPNLEPESTEMGERL